MSRWGITSGSVSPTFPYVSTITTNAGALDFPEALAYAIAWHESIQGEVNGKWSAATVVAADGGRGLFQLTSSYPVTWSDPGTNARYALSNFLVPDALYWNRMFSYVGDTLVRCIAASFNAGLGGALAGHKLGDVDTFTTDDYAAAVLRIYSNLILTGKPG